jgi:hypothetical protein
MNQTRDAVDVSGWEPLVERLHKYFHDHAHSECLLWVNPAQIDLFADSEFVKDRRVQVPINHPRFDVSLGPYLVQLDLAKSADADVLRASVESAWDAWGSGQLLACQGQPIAGWVEAGVEPKTLARHWAMHCHLHRRSGYSKLLRFHDPSVREWLWPTLTATQRRALLGPATSLFSIGRQKTLIQHCAEQGGLPGQLDSHEVEHLPNFTLENHQWDQVEEYAVVHAAWVAWTSTQPVGGGRHLDARWEQGVFAALSHASRHGVLDPQDRELFALHAMQIGSDFHTSTLMRPVWEKTIAGDFYGSAIEEVFDRPANQLHTYLSAP